MMTTGNHVFLALSLHLTRQRFHLDDDDDVLSVEPYVEIARKAHAASLDSLFLADHPSLVRDPSAALKHTVDPFVILSAVLAQVPDIAGIYTTSAIYNHPYDLARKLQTLNWFSRGRVIWNAVATWNPEVAANFGSQLANHDDRYARTSDALSLIEELWSSWHTGDQDPHAERGNRISSHHPFYDIAGPLNVPLPPWGNPVIAQAGGSPQGVELAGKYASLVYASLHSKSGGREYKRELDEQARKHGRGPSDPVRLLPGLTIAVERTTDQVEASRINIFGTPGTDEFEGRARKLAAQLSLDLSTLDRDAVLASESVAPAGPLPQGFVKAIVALLDEEPLSFNDLVQRRVDNHKIVVGTPVDIADHIQDWWSSGAVDGFVINPYGRAQDRDLFLDEVVPILQTRGIFPDGYQDTTARERFTGNATELSDGDHD
jgi:FMN-dependent oxidoreductase (nitrilotriacetate monooxygenase family)